MNSLVVALCVLLSLVFGASAAGKIRAPDRGRRAFESLRLSVPRPDLAAFTVIALEALVATGLLFATGWLLAATAWLATTLTAGLLVVVARAHHLGSDDDCGCFGEWMPARIGAPLIIRNGALTLSAAIVAALSTMAAIGSVRVGIPGLFMQLSAGETSILWALAACVLVAMVVGTSIHALAPTSATANATDRGAGAVVTPHNGLIVDLLSPGPRGRLVVFLSPGCHACATAHSLLSAEAANLNTVVDVYAVYSRSSGDLEDIHSFDTPPRALLAIDVAGSLSRALGMGNQRPFAVLISTSGEVVRPMALGSDEIAQLVKTIVTAAPHVAP